MSRDVYELKTQTAHQISKIGEPSDELHPIELFSIFISGELFSGGDWHITFHLGDSSGVMTGQGRIKKNISGGSECMKRVREKGVKVIDCCHEIYEA